MKYVKSCENCIWFGKCSQEDVCDSYDPISLEDEDIAAAEYESELRDRQEYYQELIDEQNN